MILFSCWFLDKQIRQLISERRFKYLVLDKGGGGGGGVTLIFIVKILFKKSVS